MSEDMSEDMSEGMLEGGLKGEDWGTWRWGLQRLGYVVKCVVLDRI